MSWPQLSGPRRAWLLIIVATAPASAIFPSKRISPAIPHMAKPPSTD
jgi:hypothetical protein